MPTWWLGWRRGALVLMIGLSVPAVSSGQNLVRAIDLASSSSRPPSDRPRVLFTPTAQDDVSTLATDATLQSARSRPNSGMKWGIAIDIATGAALAAGAATRYGENEGGRFCGGCFVPWSLISVSAGAGVGAAVGYLIDRAAPLIAREPTHTSGAGPAVPSSRERPGK